MYNTIKKIQKRGFLRAGVSLGINGLSYFDKENSAWTGFDIDIAKSISVALLGDYDAIQFIPLQSGQRFSALQSNVIDIGTFNATLNLSREVEYGLSFMEPLLYDGEAFLVRKDLFRFEQAGHISNLKSRVVSAIRGSTTYRNLEIYFSKKHLNYEVIMSETPDEALAAYERNDCNIYCLDRILLVGERLRLHDPDAHLILPDVISREAMSPVISSNDPNWAMAVKWILKALIEAEELGISQENVTEKKDQSSDYIRNFLNPSPDLCRKLGLINNFTEKIITQVGNYADIYHRNLGDSSALQLNRGENNLRSKGGLLFSPLFI
jgi:polar amino acid transport system substrate-binding protein